VDGLFLDATNVETIRRNKGNNKEEEEQTATAVY